MESMFSKYRLGEQGLLQCESLDDRYLLNIIKIFQKVGFEPHRHTLYNKYVYMYLPRRKVPVRI